MQRIALAVVDGVDGGWGVASRCVAVVDGVDGGGGVDMPDTAGDSEVACISTLGGTWLGLLLVVGDMLY
jgi:hypothetical protein